LGFPGNQKFRSCSTAFIDRKGLSKEKLLYGLKNNKVESDYHLLAINVLHVNAFLTQSMSDRKSKYLISV
jgi:hypothetical protein